MNMLLKGACFIVIIACVGAMIYSIVNAIRVSKRNKAKEEADLRIFLSQNKIGEKNKTDSEDQSVVTPSTPQMPLDTMFASKKVLDYDNPEDDLDLTNTTGKGLKDFFSNND